MVLADSVTLLTTQAEHVAMSDVAKEISFLRLVWRFMLPRVGMPCIPLFEDNEGAIQMAKHPISNSNSKHIDVRHHFLRELVEKKEVEIIHVASQYQHADFLTKALPEREFEFCLLYTSPSPRDATLSRMPSSA